MPSARAWTSAASRNSVDATVTAGTPLISNQTVSCKLHVVQEPQSASASTRKSHCDRMSCLRSSGHGLVKVGFANRLISTSGKRLAINSSKASRKMSPRGFRMSIRPTTPLISPVLGVICRVTGTLSLVGSRIIVINPLFRVAVLLLGSLRHYSSIFRETEVEPISPVAQPWKAAENLPASEPATTI